MSPEYEITARELKETDFDVNTTGHIYTGNAIEPDVESKNILVKSNDYEVAYSDHLNAGTATIRITGKNNAKGTVEIPFVIEKATPKTNFPSGLKIGTVIENRKATLADIQLNEGYSWSDSKTEIEYGKHEYEMIYTPSDTNNYLVVNQKVEVEGLDVTAPTATIQIKNHQWNQLFNEITFELFFKETQIVNISAQDKESSVKKVEYYLADQILTTEELESIQTWTLYEGSFTITPNHKYVIYVKVTDHAGNHVIVNTTQFVLDSLAPVITGIEDGKTYYQNVEVKVNDNYLDKITVNDQEVELTDSKFVLMPSGNKQTVKAYDKAGNVSESITVNVKENHKFIWDEVQVNEDGIFTKLGYCECGSRIGYKTPIINKQTIYALELEAKKRDTIVELIIEDNQSKVDKKSMIQIKKKIGSEKSIKYVDIRVNNNKTKLDISQTIDILELPIKYDFTDKENILIYRNHEGKVEAFKKLDTHSKKLYQDGTYYLDRENGIIYIYSNQFSTFAISSKAVNDQTPQTSDSSSIFNWMICLILSGLFVTINKKKK